MRRHHSPRSASMGLRSAARLAGISPDVTPTTTEITTASTSACHAKTTGRPMIWVATERRHQAEDGADGPADDADGGRLDEELEEHVPPGGPDGAAHADLGDALADVGQHDVHDPDPAHEERDGGDRGEHRRHRVLRLLALAGAAPPGR